MENIRLSEDQLSSVLRHPEIKKLIEEWREKRIEYHHKWREWIDPLKIKEISDEELKQKFEEYYKIGAGRHSFNQIYRDRITRDIERFRNMLLYLLDESVDITERLNEILNKNGKYYIQGVGKALVTSFLFDFNPNKYCIWNNKVEAGLGRIGWLPEKKGVTKGEYYLKILEVIKKLVSLSSEPYNNFGDVDLALHILAVEKEGDIALKEILGIPVQKDLGEENEYQVMERTLQDFLKKNFSKIFPSLEIYQDEESDGFEYPTSFGRIDILTKEKNTGNFIVIELKGGKASSDVVGQILSYMAWVEENLADNSKVKGIIICQDVDEKLKFALKKTKDIEVYTFKMSFTVEEFEL